jgi:hypothetical protein
MRSLKTGANPVKPASAPSEGLCAAAETADAANEVADASAKWKPALASAADTGGWEREKEVDKSGE